LLLAQGIEICLLSDEADIPISVEPFAIFSPMIGMSEGLVNRDAQSRCIVWIRTLVTIDVAARQNLF